MRDSINFYSAKEIAAICKVDLATARRWKRRATCPPETALMILAGDLGCFGPNWRNWVIRGDDIISPDGWTISRNDALIVPLMHGQISALRHELAKALAQIKDAEVHMDEQPNPAEWPSSVYEMSR